MEISETILRQMGGAHRLRAMIGAYDFMGSEKDQELHFKWKAKAKNGANALTITLDPSDTYTMQFWKLRAGKVTKLGKFDMLYEDQIIPLFEGETGLRLRF
jgi:hypothetical protein